MAGDDGGREWTRDDPAVPTVRHPGRRRTRPALSRERIIATAIEFVDEHGLTALTMRRLGKRARRRGDVALPLRQRPRGPARGHRRPHGRRSCTCARTTTELGPTDGWQAYLQWLAHGVRSLARDHPKVFPLIATRHPAAPWLRPPLRSLRVVEDFLSTLIARGFSDAARGEGLPGLLQLPARAPAAGGQPARRPDRARPRSRSTRATPTSPTPTRPLDLADFPHIRRLEASCPRTTPAPEFERALEDLLDRLDREITEQ